ncbi:MAG: DNRLRE domain-containing protein [Planctomycetota bacterium]|jgi:hypothetical protein
MKKLTSIAVSILAVCGVLQAGETASFRAIDDAYVDSVDTTASTGGESFLYTQGLFNATLNERAGIPIDSVQRTFLKFDISSIPAGSTIESGFFGIYLNDSYAGAANASLELYYVADDSWNETDINWNNSQAMASSGELVRIAQPVTTNGYYEWNLLSGIGNDLDLAADLADDGLVTMMLKTQFEGANSSAEFFSDEHFNNRPYLDIGYTNPVPAPGAITLAMLGMGSVLATRKRK